MPPGFRHSVYGTHMNLRKLPRILVAPLIAGVVVITATPALAFYSEATNAGNSDKGIVVSDGSNVYTVGIGKKIGGNLVGWWTDPFRCTSVSDLDNSPWNQTVNAANSSAGTWSNFPVPGHHYYMFTWNC